MRSHNQSGFKGVSASNNIIKPFKAKINRGGGREYLGPFSGAAEAALAYARALGPEGCAVAVAPAAAAAGAATADDEAASFCAKLLLAQQSILHPPRG